MEPPARPVALVLRALGLGDFATGLPALRAVRRAYPDHEVVLAAPAVLAPLVVASGAVDRHLATPSYAGRPVDRLPRLDPPAVAVNLHGRGPQSTRALAGLDPGRLLAFAGPGGGGPAWRAGEHEVARWCRLLDWYGIPADPGDLDLPAPGPGAAGPGAAGAVLVHPGASGPERRWPVDCWAAVARALRAAGHRVLVTGSAAEVPLATAVAGGAGLPPGAVAAGRTDLAGLAWSVAHARLVLSGDTGIAHLATAYGTPSVVLFGPLSPAEWGPPPDRPRHVALWRGRAGLPGIRAADVLAAAAAALAAGTPATGPAGGGSGPGGGLPVAEAGTGER